MTIRSLKSAFLGSIAAIAMMLTVTHLCAAEAPESKAESKGKSVAELQQERLAILQQLVKVAYADYRAGKIDIEMGMRAQQQLLDAELERATDRESRMKILSDSVKLATEWRKVAEARFHAGQASQADVLQCQAQCLKAEVALQREVAMLDGVASYPVLSGVGVALGVEEEHVLVNKILPGSPADESEFIQEGMRIVAVEADGEETPTAGKTMGEVASLIRGPVDTTVILTIASKGKEGSEKKVRLKRKPLELSGIPTSYQSMIGKSLPDVAMRSLEEFSLVEISDYRGKIIVLDFWASWCPTCYQQVERMQQLRKEHPEWNGVAELATVTVNANSAKATEVIRNRGWNRTLNLAIDEDGREAIGIHAVPVVIIVASDGTIAVMAEAHAVDIAGEVSRLLMSTFGSDRSFQSQWRFT